MNAALENLRRSNPRAFDQFIETLSEQLGVRGLASVFRCPRCDSKLEVRIAREDNGNKSRSIYSSMRFRSSGSSDGLNFLLIELARLRRTTTGTINAEFKKTMGQEIKNLRKKEQRAKKVQWLRYQISKSKRS